MDSTYSNGDYKRLGDRIRNNPAQISIQDLKMLQSLRLSYKDLLSEVFSVLVSESKKIERTSISTYRVKRIESIISKLQRVDKMQLNRMSDIAGCRCILQSVDKVYQLKEKLQKVFIVKNINDYISSPKMSGYRSLHMIVSLPNSQDNKTIEIQLRTRDQHNWATLVEITDLVYGTKIKETGCDGELAEFHRLLSFIYDNKLTKTQYERIVHISNSKSYFKKISGIFHNNYFAVRNQWNAVKQSNDKFFLIAADSTGLPIIKSFKKIEEAESAYFDNYMDNPNNKNIVLTHISTATFDQISLAYSNYFLTYNKLFFQCYQIMSSLVVNAYDNKQCFKFKGLYKEFLDLTEHFIGMNVTDLVQFQNKKLTIRSNKKRVEWWGSIKHHLGLISDIFNYTQQKLNGGCVLCNLFKYITIRSFLRNKTEQKKHNR